MEQAKKKIIVIVVLLLVIVGSVGSFLIWKHSQDNSYAYDDLAKNGIIEARTQEEIQRILNQQVEKGTFNVSINQNPTFANGSSEGNVWIENVPNNTSDLKVVITLPDRNDEKIFETKKIRPNQNIKEAKLDVTLAKGDYRAIAHFFATDPESGKNVGDANVEITISIQN